MRGRRWRRQEGRKEGRKYRSPVRKGGFNGGRGGIKIGREPSGKKLARTKMEDERKILNASIGCR